MRNRERRNRLDQQPCVARDYEQRQHEQKMIDAEQDVFNAKLEVEAGHRPAALTREDRRRRFLWGQAPNPVAPVQESDAHERIGHRIFQPDNSDFFTA